MKCSHLLYALGCLALSAQGADEEKSGDTVRSPNGEIYSASAYQAGRDDAAKDIREHRLILESFGSSSPWDGDYAKILEERYHIQLKIIATCLVHDQCFGHAKGYNRVAQAEIRRLFGGEALREAWAEAKQRHEASAH